MKKMKINEKKRLLNKLVKREKEVGVSYFAKFPKTPIPTLFKILDSISPKMNLAKREVLEYKIFDEIGERLYNISYDVQQYNDYIRMLNLPIYLLKL